MKLLRSISNALVTRPRLSGAVAGIACLGLLLWARLIVVSNMPRTAIAEEQLPDAQQSTQPADPTPDTDEMNEENDEATSEMKRSHLDN